MIVIGIDHETTSAEVIARARRNADQLARSAMSAPSITGVIVLATCARVEVYVDGTRFHEAQSIVSAEMGCEPSLLRSRRGESALTHLFAVCAGLRSAAVGEAEITGQVRSALARARAAGTVTTALGMAFEQSIAAARAARPLLSRPTRSLASLALDSLTSESHASMNPVHGATAVVLGSGDFATTVTHELRHRGAAHIAAFSRSGRVLDGADEMLDFTELLETLATTDVLIAASGRIRLLSQAELAKATTLRRTPLRIVDLTGGIDIDATAAGLTGVSLIGLDDLSREPTSDSHAAEKEVSSRASAAWARIVDTELSETIIALRRLVEVAADAARTGNPAVDAALRRATRSLLHEPTVRARDAATEGRLHEVQQALRTLFGCALDEAMADLPTRVRA